MNLTNSFANVVTTKRRTRHRAYAVGGIGALAAGVYAKRGMLAKKAKRLRKFMTGRDRLASAQLRIAGKTMSVRHSQLQSMLTPAGRARGRMARLFFGRKAFRAVGAL